jgi:hypothetical protein
MDIFNKYLTGKKFILFTDHKPLEKMGHLHTKTMNRVQAALLEHDFIIQYKKGAVMPDEYLSRLPLSNPDKIAKVTECFDSFEAGLTKLQKADVNLQSMNHFQINGQWPKDLLKSRSKLSSELGTKTLPRCKQNCLD